MRDVHYVNLCYKESNNSRRYYTSTHYVLFRMSQHRPEDLAFYQKLQVPAPILEPIDRRKRRLIFRNERSLYRASCAATGKSILSMYAPEKGFTVYDFNYWHSDNWEALTYGRDIDFSRPFFEQFAALYRVVPKLNVIMDSKSENSEFVNQCGNLRNCYLVFDSDMNEDSLYCHTLKHSRSCMDCLYMENCELCYECINCRECYGVLYGEDCENSRDSAFLLDCKGCNNCIGCYGLRNKEYCIFNEEVGKEEFARRKQEFQLDSYLQREAFRPRFETFIAGKRPLVQRNVNCDNCTGNYMHNSRNAANCSFIDNVDNAAYSSKIFDTKDCRDFDVWGDRCELIYECVTVGEGAHTIGCSFDVWMNVQNIWYSASCVRSKNLFGCVGLRDKQYCILNKQYTKEEYEELVPKLRAHMQQTGEWGQFFPASMSPFGYNETMAQDEYPLTEAQAIAEGFQWYTTATSTQTVAHPFTLADSISTYADPQQAQELIQGILVSEGNQKPYKVVPQELALYMKLGVPVPHRSHEERHQARCTKLTHIA